MAPEPEDAAPWPLEIRLLDSGRRLEVDFDDGSRFSLPAELLRVESPSAEVRGHGAGEKTIVAGRRRVAIGKVEPVGRYAVRLRFDDGHDSGLYSWPYLYRLGRDRERIWQAYLDALDERGLGRDP